ncbi:hypothetical protein L21SP3_00738 [Sedimentisphaera cyanobacteriorum]|uniref:Uncharacterized protein n=1 Tax=Sedimentisphaera cyanobacteriorum TaxID=1940790 RepID=A0A1Q2HNV7_9BACT|nr:hypothetical protein [Sedimentisphaera cyanobacteriorum]AQQ08944.1 hypothetical protein L21SP3_00738 [Sedimentisphaera cyanobacteriorum]
MASRYTVYGDKIDSLIDSHCELINQAVLSVITEHSLEAVVLAGGYGRQEGGVFFEDGEEKLYNDYDMFVVIKDGAKASDYQEKLNALSPSLEERCGIEVDFGPLKTVSQMKKAPFTLFNYELKYGHKIIWGNKNTLDIMPDYEGSQISLIEAAKLLLNRGAGLILASERLKESSLDRENDEFVTRNIYKALMAQGDSLIMAEGQYHFSYRKRLEIFNSLQKRPEVAEFGLEQLFADSMEYKFRPQRNMFSKEQLEQLLKKTVGLHLQIYCYTMSRLYRTEESFDVVLDSIKNKRLEKVSAKQILKNVALNCRTCGFKNFSLKWYLKYPRYRLFYVLPHFLGDKTLNLRQVCRALGCESENQKRSRFMCLWERFN